MEEVPDGELWYPTVGDILTLHEEIIAEDPDATPGTEDANRIEFAIDYVREGHYGEVPETIHEKAFHLMRLLASNHWFADGNKRTALSTVEEFYFFNGLKFDYGEDVRSMLKLFSVREDLIDEVAGAEFLSERTSLFQFEDEEVERYLQRIESRIERTEDDIEQLAERIDTEFNDHNG